LSIGSSQINRYAEKISAWQSKRPFLTATGLSLVILAVLMPIDAFAHVSGVRILYLLPIWLAARLDGRRGALAMVVIVSAAMFGEDLLKGTYHSGGAAVAETGFRVLAFSSIAWIIAGVETRLAKTENWAMRDPLTGVFNRRALNEFWEAKIVSDPSPNSYVVVMIDCDGFKNLNDRYGHEAGNRVLQMLGYVLASETRRTDLVARVGGDEFVVLLKETVPTEARRILSRIEGIFESRVRDAGYSCTLSVGYALPSSPRVVDGHSLSVCGGRVVQSRVVQFKNAAPRLS
jgi:diguanylate cyclase (GGDEF)-like protein